MLIAVVTLVSNLPRYHAQPPRHHHHPVMIALRYLSLTSHLDFLYIPHQCQYKDLLLCCRAAILK